jgi:ABC-type transport system involved in cytochrome c biogenesis permease subunit
VLAIFSLFGTVHHARQAWAIFVLPLVIGLVLLSYLLLTGSARSDHVPSWILGDRTWGLIHGTLILFAAVGVGVASLSGVMYLVQSDRVRRKRPPFGGVQLLNLERLETMNRRAVVAAFPFLTVGLILGAVLLKSNHDVGMNWWSFKVLGTAGLWAVFLVLMYLRYSHSVSARRMAWLSLAAFLLTVVVLAAVHPFADAAGGTP